MRYKWFSNNSYLWWTECSNAVVACSTCLLTVNVAKSPVPLTFLLFLVTFPCSNFVLANLKIDLIYWFMNKSHVIKYYFMNVESAKNNNLTSTVGGAFSGFRFISNTTCNVAISGSRLCSFWVFFCSIFFAHCATIWPLRPFSPANIYNCNRCKCKCNSHVFRVY